MFVLLKRSIEHILPNQSIRCGEPGVRGRWGLKDGVERLSQEDDDYYLMFLEESDEINKDFLFFSFVILFEVLVEKEGDSPPPRKGLSEEVCARRRPPGRRDGARFSFAAELIPGARSAYSSVCGGMCSSFSRGFLEEKSF
ncbi:hypothetical protein NPIL_550941 [Nephila pilipes]|uniref:Uncharacterized protein n=1 Tax=Nephila pilipes TaxID=299642 RepID=A0A8X6N8D1_NEPPI|nr:hypothetical protein NPIL_550941 [Nephila pilipes]